MKIIATATLLAAVLLAGAAQPKPARVPPPGLTIAGKDRDALRAGADELAVEIESLRSSPGRELLPDVEIFHKAVDWALRYDEFYRSNEVGLARALLKTGMERAKQLREGKPSWLTATGLVVRGYVSKIDGSVQPYGLVVPATFALEQNKARRLDVWLHGRDNNLTELNFLSDRMKSYGEFTPADTFVLHPYGRYCNAFKFAGETDVFEALEHVKISYRIDDQRIALRGFSMGGAGAWHLGAHHPGVWAVVAPGAGFAETAEYQKLGTNRAKFPTWEQKLWQLYDATDYAANFANVPVISYAGLQDPQRQSGDVMERAMRAEGLKLPRVWGTNIGHKYTPEAKREVNAFVDAAVARGAEKFPREVRLTTRTLAYPRAAGLEIVALEQHWRRADVVLRDLGDRLEISATNVAELRVARAPGSKSVRDLIINGGRLRATPENSNEDWSVTVAKDAQGRWFDVAGLSTRPNTLVKRHGLQGPVDDAFTGSFLVVRPTGKAANETTGAWVNAQLAKATNEWRAQFRGDARVKDDSQVTDADIVAHNLILFGDPQSNRLLARIVDKLPIQWSAPAVKVGDKTFSAATHAPVFIFPNPLNPNRYVVVNSGFTFAAAGNASNAQQTPKLPDYAVFELAGNSVVLADFFDEQWRLR
jgi:predicted esterase